MFISNSGGFMIRTAISFTAEYLHLVLGLTLVLAALGYYYYYDYAPSAAPAAGGERRTFHWSWHNKN